MTIEETVVTILEGTGAAVYPNAAPENADYPFLVYQIISDTSIRSHAGPVMDRPRLQVSVWSKNYGETVTLAQTVKAALDLNRTDFKLATRENELDAPDVEPGLYRRVLDFMIWHQEGV